MIRTAFFLGAIALPTSAALADPDKCAVLRVAAASGTFLTQEMADEIPCREEEPRPSIRYDRVVEAPAATEALAAGTYLGRLSLRSGAIAAVGDKLELVVRRGPVKVTREVRAIQSVRAGDNAFIKTSDGEVLTARFVAAEEAR